ncbi:MAG: superoxide dismutase, Fe-Mn family [Parcubacteria group bacterium Athens0416_74]|nr:MAG: superoxide dismutase, Fe-Mn family [Parcubacteria group bacterium Athens0416_74]
MYTAKTFTIPDLDGISKKSVDEHIGLYQGYVNNFNAITSAAVELMSDAEKHAHAISELWRRRSFEFDGMRLHEYYFEQLEGGTSAPNPSSPFGKQIALEYPMGGDGQPQLVLKNIGNMRGPGWALLYWDPVGKCFQTGFSGEQHQGHFVSLPIILALDVWEHAYLLDYGTKGKGSYIDAFFKNINWSVVEKRFDAASA